MLGSIMPVFCFAQVDITGRVLNQTDTKPVASLQTNTNFPVLAKLERYLADRPIEKAYLQFDKPYYAAGDTVYFKAYVTAGELHKPGGLSGVLHVDLINTKNKIDQSIKLKLDSGHTRGDFALPDTLPAGNYRVRAYTQWMRNFGENAFFDKIIPVGSPKSIKIPESLAKQPITDMKPDVQFFPEGGSLVAGILSKVAFKAIGANGLGTDVKGTIVDDQNNEIAKFEPGHLGMGYFYITPAGGKNYKAKISLTNGSQDLIALSTPLTDGITLSVNNDSIPKASIRIEASAGYYRQNRGKIYSLVIYSQGIATTVNCKLDSVVIDLDILKRKLHTGVAVVTLFSPENEPLSERLFFVQNYDRLSLNTDHKDSYAKREHVSVRLNVHNRRGEPASGNFSVAVIDENKVGEHDNSADNILTSLLLTSDLKGYVEQPDYYFADTSTTARQNLDLLMLTQGYRRFEWKKVLDSAVEKPAYLPEDGLSVAGQVKNVFNKPVAGGTINLFQPIGGLLLSVRTDDKGMFRFKNLFFSDTAHMILSAVKANGKNSTQISLSDENAESPDVHAYKRQNESLFDGAIMDGYLANDKLEHIETLNYLTGKGVMLKQVNIRDKKLDDKYETSNLLGAGHADQILHHEDVRYGTTLAGALLGRLHGIRFIDADAPSGGVPILAGSGIMQVIVDGVYYPPNSGINLVNPNDVETVEVLKYGDAAIYGMAGGHGVIIITTRRGGGLDIKDVVASGVLPITVMGFYKARTFYSPRYDHAGIAGNQPDLRSTIYWDPQIKTDENGNASFDFYNADGAGNYKVTIEGVDKDGNIGRQVYFYEVK